MPVGEVKVVPAIDLFKVQVEGPGVEPGMVVGDNAKFTVDATKAGAKQQGKTRTKMAALKWMPLDYRLLMPMPARAT